MKVYLVGGAVRDQVLGLPIKERDWVVIGAKACDLLAKDFIQVGRDFPVFLHPQTKEEYALARTERKKAPGYYGFECDFNPNIKLEDDLARRDLTINAMAMDENKRIIDPYGGLKDINNRILRHVSPAFAEDPVRVLRVARFAARYHYLGFKLANETRLLMYDMVQKGELSHLVSERVWQEWQASFTEKNPELFILTLRSCDALRVILPELNGLFGIPNPCKYHLEIDSGIHSIMTLKAATALSTDPITRFAALVHDLGKAATPINQWPKHHGHEESGITIIEAMAARLRIPKAYKDLAVMVCRFHLIIHRLFDLGPSTIVKTLEKTDAFRRSKGFLKLLIAARADAEGCGRNIDYHYDKKWHYILNECAKINSQQMIALGYQGLAIKNNLHLHRIKRVALILNSWKIHEK